MTDEQLREQIELKLHGMIVNRETTDGILRKYADELIALFEAGRSGDTIPVPRALLMRLFDLAVVAATRGRIADLPDTHGDTIDRTAALLARTKETTTDA